MFDKLILMASILLLFVIALIPHLSTTTKTGFRPPAVPLLVYDPYLSIWSNGTYLANQSTRAWRGKIANLTSLIKIDGRTYRLMGKQPNNLSTLEQKSLTVFPLRSVYVFEGHGISVTMTFFAPRVPSNLKIFSWPITYIVWNIYSTDDHIHRVKIYYSTSSQLAVNTFDEKVDWERKIDGSVLDLKIGTVDQPILGLAGDKVGIDWGYIHTAVFANQADGVIGKSQVCKERFISNGTLPEGLLCNQPVMVKNGEPVEAIIFNLGKVGNQSITRYAIVALDEQYAVDYFGTWLRPYWMHWYSNIREILMDAAQRYNNVYDMAVKFDNQLMEDCTKVGGERYAQICALAYRQSIAAIGMAEDSKGNPLLFTKENSSNGDISTVDVIYPTSPVFLLFNPDLLKGSLVPVLDYAESSLWHKDFAPHDLGTYPKAKGYFRKLGEIGLQMPVEETGNMIIMMDAIAHIEGNVEFASKYWLLLTKWVKYLLQNGFDPGNQLCTDDFAGPMPHNANLSVKSIEAIGAYAQLCQMRGDEQDAEKYMNIAKEWAIKWSKIDLSNDGTHYLLGFDSSQDSWSQKYNMVWDEILDLNLFPEDAVERETRFYLTKLQKFGLPLDSRKLYTKTDWTIWTASLRPNTPYFHKLVDLVYKFLDETPSRVPLSDFYWTQHGKTAGMFARSVVGAAFITMLTDKTTWNKWVSMSDRINEDWAPLPNSYILFEPFE